MKEKISKKKIMQLASVILAFGINVVLFFVLLKPADMRPKNGVLDLAKWETSDTVNLNGEWNFIGTSYSPMKTFWQASKRT